MSDSQIAPASEQLLPKSQVAERYQCSTRTVERLRKGAGFTEQEIALNDV